MSEGFTKWGGEFASRERETAFRERHIAEKLRYARLAFLLSAILHALFLVSDWRFFGTPHFWAAIPARLTIIAVSLLCLAMVRRARHFARIEGLIVAWMIATAICVALLVTAHSDIALFAVLFVPLMFYLGAPVAFRKLLACTAGASALILAAFLLPHPPSTAPGLIIIVISMNVALAMQVVRGNRLQRLEWARGLEVAEGRAQLDQFFNAAPVPLIVTRLKDGSVVRSNEAGYAFFGTTPDKAGTQGEGYLDPATRSHLLDQVARHGRISNFETRMRLADGTIRDVLLAASQITVDGKACLMTGVIDITTRKVLEAHLEQLATTDSLTSLANRARFFTVAETEIRRASRKGKQPSLLMIDLDHFKNINDDYGHDAGDQVLKAFADLAVGMARDHDTAARLGGEEFAILLPEATLAAASRIAERLRAATEAMRIDTIPSLRVTVSIGVARVEGGETTPDAALSRADRALYRAKRSGRNRVSSADRKVDADDSPQS